MKVDHPQNIDAIKTLHLVSFDVPYPPNYGGVIDVYYKLKNLAEEGLNIYLHTYEYGRGEQKQLEAYCKKVCYYPRKDSATQFLSKIPFIVKTRNSKALIKNLSKDKHPILFEGLHTTYPLIEDNFEGRKILIRTHNIEHEYYKGLKKSETNKRKKLFFEAETKKLKKYEAILNKADHILTISPFEQAYFKKKYGQKAIYVPAFFSQKRPSFNAPQKKFTLWHGDLRVADNCKAALFIIDVFSKLDEELVIASNTKKPEILKEIKKHTHIVFDDLNKSERLEELLVNAHIHALITHQKTGIKLKLLNALRKGKFVVANDKIAEDTGLEKACHISNTKTEFRNTIKMLLSKNFKNQDLEIREAVLSNFDPSQNAKKIIDLL